MRSSKCTGDLWAKKMLWEKSNNSRIRYPLPATSHQASNEKARYCGHSRGATSARNLPRRRAQALVAPGNVAAEHLAVLRSGGSDIEHRRQVVDGLV